MIPKLICFIFGHKRQHKVFIRQIDEFTTHWRFVDNENCPRCGVKV